MGSRKRKSGAEVLLHLVALLPWWVGVALAVVTFAVLHSIAGLPVPAPTNTAQISGSVIRTLITAGAALGQYVIPPITLIAAAFSYSRCAKRKQLLDATQSADSPDILHTMSWREFESLVGEAFRLQGYSALETGHLGQGADGGVDLILKKDGKKYLVQCKQWRSQTVDVRVVRELFGVMAAQSARGGFVVTSGRFTSAAHDFAKGKPLRLIEGDALHALLRAARASQRSPAPVSSAPAPSSVPAPALAPAPAEAARATAALTCPQCGGDMVMRKARRGSNAGHYFWGCVKFPACRGTRGAEQIV